MGVETTREFDLHQVKNPEPGHFLPMFLRRPL